ncbi:glutamyl endopeptidase [Enterococcus sp. DIV0724b]|uniref:trypsin-like serine peptidase n=1 Tax=Enterococcus sp. DIV0724b TaxID=2774694 RepID=UPI003D2F9FB4
MKIQNLVTALLCTAVLSTTVVVAAPQVEAAHPVREQLTDNKAKVSDTTKGHFQSVTFIDANGVTGTGTVIAKNKVVTSYNVVEGLKNSENLAKTFVTPGKDGENAPFGSFQVESVSFEESWKNMAVLTLQANDNGQNIGEVVSVVPVTKNPSILVCTEVTMPGYDADKKGEMWESQATISYNVASNFWFNQANKTGNYGGPIFDRSGNLIGIRLFEKYSKGVQTSAAKFTERNYDFISENLK